MKILLLYDTGESDMARDLREFLSALDLEVLMIPELPDKGRTLEAKESDSFADADAVVFLLTPGALRGGRMFPSPSVSSEMGQAKQRFAASPEKIIYLVDSNCQPPTIDQAAYNRFDRQDARSVIAALARLIRELRCAGILWGPIGGTPRGIDRLQSPAQPPDRRVIAACVELSRSQGGCMKLPALRYHLKQLCQLSEQEANFVFQDLVQAKLIYQSRAKTSLSDGEYTLTSAGWSLARSQSDGDGP